MIEILSVTDRKLAIAAAFAQLSLIMVLGRLPCAIVFQRDRSAHFSSFAARFDNLQIAIEHLRATEAERALLAVSFSGDIEQARAIGISHKQRPAAFARPRPNDQTLAAIVTILEEAALGSPSPAPLRAVGDTLERLAGRMPTSLPTRPRLLRKSSQGGAALGPTLASEGQRGFAVARF